MRARSAREGMVAMGSLSIWHWMLFGAVALLVFGGKGKISDIMGDVAKGIKSFKKGMSEDDEAPTTASSPRTIENRPASGADVGDKQKVG
jgi:sec-independent protein translocase protein TatA